MDEGATLVLGLLAAVALLFYVAWRANELFRIAVRDGRVELVRGRPPPGFLDDVRRIAAHAREGTVRGVKRDGKPALVTTGLDEATTQRLRNTFATYAVTVRSGSRL